MSTPSLVCFGASACVLVRQIKVEGTVVYSLYASPSAFPLPDGDRDIMFRGSTVTLSTSASGGVSILALDLELNVTQFRTTTGVYYLSIGMSSGVVDSGIMLEGCDEAQPTDMPESPRCDSVESDVMRAACNYDLQATGDSAYAVSASRADEVYSTMYVEGGGGGKGKGNAGAIAGIVIGVVLGVALIGGVAACVVMQQKRSKKKTRKAYTHSSQTSKDVRWGLLAVGYTTSITSTASSSTSTTAASSTTSLLASALCRRANGNVK